MGRKIAMLATIGMLDKNVVYQIIINRLKRKYHIDLEKHIKQIIEKHAATGDRFDFIANDTEILIDTLTKADFRY